MARDKERLEQSEEITGRFYCKGCQKDKEVKIVEVLNEDGKYCTAAMCCCCCCCLPVILGWCNIKTISCETCDKKLYEVDKGTVHTLQKIGDFDSI